MNTAGVSITHFPRGTVLSAFQILFQRFPLERTRKLVGGISRDVFSSMALEAAVAKMDGA